MNGSDTLRNVLIRKLFQRFALVIVSAFLPFFFASRCLASDAGTTAASFLDIPVGAAPAALGSAYSVRAVDAYAPVWNPAGLGFVQGVRVSGTESVYLQGVHYGYSGVAVPVGETHEQSESPGSAENNKALGLSVQYLGSGNIAARDESGNPSGNYSASFAAYSLAYGQTIVPDWSIGLTGKVITESIDNTNAHTYAADVGTLFRVNDKLSLASVLSNMGTSIRFVSESDPLPMAAREGILYQWTQEFNSSAELVFRHGGPVSFSGGLEWNCLDTLFLRSGVDTSHSSGLSTLSAFTAGAGIRFWGQEFAFAWIPYGDLGNTFNLSLDLKFGGSSEERPSLTHHATEMNDELAPSWDRSFNQLPSPQGTGGVSIP